MQATLSFCKLIKRINVSYEEETQEQHERWVRNVVRSVGADAYTFDTDNDGYVGKEFTADEIEFVSAGEVDLYVFCGSAYEEERFYNKEAFIVKERATGDYYALETEDIYDI